MMRMWWHRIWRIARHRWTDEGDLRRVFPPQRVQALLEAVRSGEAQHSGEVRLCIEAGLPLADLWRDASARERALEVFGELRVWDTQHNNGVLIYLLLCERRIEVVADRGLCSLVPQSTWDALVKSMEAAFKAGQFETGLQMALTEVNRLLSANFPLAAGQSNPNELPDDPVMRA